MAGGRRDVGGGHGPGVGRGGARRTLNPGCRGPLRPSVGGSLGSGPPGPVSRRTHEARMHRWLAAGTALLASLVLLGAVYAAGALPCDVVGAQPRCEVALTPGPTEDTLGLVRIEGARTYPSAGQLLLTTVAVRDDLDLAQWWQARRTSSIETVPRESIYPTGSDREEVSEQNALLMADSQTTAALAALGAVGYDVDAAASGAEVASVEPDAATDELAPGDVIVGLDGEVVRDAADVVAAVRSRGPGDEVVLEVRDGGEADPREVTVTLGANPEDGAVAYIGVLLTSRIDLPVDVTIDAGVIGGPSAGLMFALGVVDLLGAEDLTAGRVVAGTGTITRDGTVGPVGGVKQKVVAASSPGGVADPAAVFLVPAANLGEAREAEVRNDVLLVPVEDLDDALAALEQLAAGEQPQDALVVAAAG
ncbi:PDZ domain-containing protein [Nitriliruptoraceae bacterium ZYF776]|nr:PDZ domain-containing protein [Profundirhabdus halotolerans]